MTETETEIQQRIDAVAKTKVPPIYFNPRISGTIARCPKCGGRVYMPCRVCQLRETTPENSVK